MADSLYVCYFSNGHIKVGRSSNPEARIAQHRDRVACLGVELVSKEILECAGNIEAREAWLIARCTEQASVRFLSEWFGGLDFGVVCTWAREAASMQFDDEGDGQTFGARLRIARVAARMTQSDLAQGLGASGADLKKAAISTWELDHCSPNVDQLRLMCERLGVSADHLIFGQPE
jgi:DNA-binding XRE family transcriptional regulator